MKIIEWHIEGNVMFMTPLTILFFINLVLIGIAFYKLYGKGISEGNSEKLLLAIKFIGGFAISFGIFSQTLGLVDVFGAIASIGEVSQAILVGGLKITMYTTIYGFIIFMLSQLSWFFLKRRTLSIK